MKNENNKKIIIIISIVIIILIILLILIQRLAESKNRQENILNQVNEYTSIDDFKTMEEVSAYLQCVLKKQEKSKDKNYDIDVYMEIKLFPYTDDQSNKAFYDKLVQYSASVLKYKNFRIIDSQNKIILEIICSKEDKKVKEFLINGESNYFSRHDSLLELNKIKKTDEIDLNIQSMILKKLINNNWKISSNDIGSKESSFEKYDIYFDEGIEIKIIDNKVFNIIFTKRYTENILNNIKTTFSRDEIIKTLGEPTYENELEECIGYKGKDIYFFYNSRNEISIYRNEKDINSKEFAKIVDEYIEKKDDNKLIQDIKEKYNDYDIYENNSNGILLQYSLKGFSIRFKRGLSRGIQIYNNYLGTIYKDIDLEKLKEIKKLPYNVFINNEDLVARTEFERISNIKNMIYSASLDKTIYPELTQSNKFYTVKGKIGENANNIKFISIDGENSNSELRENIDYYIWIDDYNFVYSIKNKGIYIYNVKSRKYGKIKESTDEEFKIIEYKDNVLKYDEKSIKLK